MTHNNVNWLLEALLTAQVFFFLSSGGSHKWYLRHHLWAGWPTTRFKGYFQNPNHVLCWDSLTAYTPVKRSGRKRRMVTPQRHSLDKCHTTGLYLFALEKMTMLFVCLFSLLQSMLEFPVLILFSVWWACAFIHVLASSPKYCKVPQNKSKWKEKKIHLIVSASAIWWKLQKSSFQGAVAEKMILWARQYNWTIGFLTALAIEVIHKATWNAYLVQ